MPGISLIHTEILNVRPYIDYFGMALPSRILRTSLRISVVKVV